MKNSNRIATHTKTKGEDKIKVGGAEARALINTHLQIQTRRYSVTSLKSASSDCCWDIVCSYINAESIRISTVRERDSPAIIDVSGQF